MAVLSGGIGGWLAFGVRGVDRRRLRWPRSDMTASARPKGHYYVALDGLRGVAALFVAALHLTAMWGRPLFSGAYLAVDFFFILSGFVIATAYDSRLRDDMTAGEFGIRRLIRLWPLFALGLALGAAYQIPRALTGLGDLRGEAAVIAAGLGFLMAPSPANLSPHGWLYPTNIPAWSLFFELVANVVYGLVAPKITTLRLAVFVAVSAILLGALAAHFGTLNLGAEAATFWGGMARVTFGFSMGMLIYRLHRVKAWSGGWGIVLAALLAGVLVMRPASWIGDVLAATIIFPAIVVAGVWIVPANGWGAGISKVLGRASYPVYALHVPLIAWLGFALNRAGIPLGSALSYLIALVVVSGVALAADRYWDIPIRSALGTRRLERIRRHGRRDGPSPDRI
jgi:peptidoglycan/LPS O-acetylase OafA/YrhL